MFKNVVDLNGICILCYGAIYSNFILIPELAITLSISTSLTTFPYVAEVI
jgi:hypothetical protein